MRRSEQFQQTLWDLQRRMGQNALIPLSALQARQCLSTGHPAIDSLLGEGIPRGQIATFLSTPSSGATTLTYHLMAQAQERDRAVVYVDFTATFDASAAVHEGVQIDRLLLIRPDTVLSGLELIRPLVTAENVALVVLDGGGLPHSGEGFAQLPTLLSRMKGSLAKSQCILLLLLASPPPESLRLQIDTLLQLERKAWLMRAEDIQGYQVEVTLLKETQNRPSRPIRLDLWLKGDSL